MEFSAARIIKLADAQNAIPTRDGDPLTVRYVLQFDDGKTLDETFSAPVSTKSSGCPMG